MQTSQILQTSFLDILFEGKNKLYGAYELRKSYNKRIAKALLATIIITSTFALIFTAAQRFQTNTPPAIIVSSKNVLAKIEAEKQKPLPKLPSTLHVKTVQFTHPVIVERIEITPPDIHQIEAAAIDVQTVDGPKADPGIINPPAEITGTGVVAKPAPEKESQKNFIPVEIEALFPGGDGAWQKYIRKAIQQRMDDFSERDYGTCIVKFMVDINGNVSDVKAATMQGTMLAEIAIAAISKGPKWIPAMQNGHSVAACRIQPVTLLPPNE